MSTESHDLDSPMVGLQICLFIPNSKMWSLYHSHFRGVVASSLWLGCIKYSGVAEM